MFMTKQSAINLLAQIVMFGVNLCISFFLVPYITEVIGVDAYGFVGLANDFVSYSQIVTVAINSMASRFITIKIHEGDKEEANKFKQDIKNGLKTEEQFKQWIEETRKKY